MRFIIIAILLFPNILFAQSNELYKLLNWNNPKQQQQLIAWYDLQDAATIKKNSSSPENIYGINDKGIWKNHIIQREPNNQPLLTKVDGFANGSKNGISFSNGGYMVYKFPKEKNVTAITSFVVCKNDIGGSKLLYDLSKEGGEGIASCYSGLFKIESRVPNSLADFEPTFSNNPEKYLLISTKGSSGKINAYLNGTNYSGPGSRNFQGTSYNQIRLSTENGVAPTDGTLHELILFDVELSDDEFNIVKKYLENKYKLDPTRTEITQASTNSSNTYRSALIEGKANSGISNTSNEISYVRLGDIDVLTSDLGEMTYEDAKNAIKNLGDSWRLPNENELKLMFKSQDKIGTLSKREFKVVQDYWIYGGNYLGENPNGQLVLLRTLVDPGYTISYNKSGVDKRTLIYIRAVRGQSTVKVNNNNNQSVEYNFSELKSQGCDVIKYEFKEFAIKYINYRKRVKSNPYSLRINEDTDWENKLRKFSDLVAPCAIKMKGDYASEVLGYYDNITALLPIEPKIASLGTNKSYNQNKSNTNSGSTQTNNKVNKSVDMSTEVLSQVVSCKTCGNSVTVVRNVPRSPELKQTFNEMGGVTSSMCHKCNKTSQYTYEIKAGRFTKIN